MTVWHNISSRREDILAWTLSMNGCGMQLGQVILGQPKSQLLTVSLSNQYIGKGL